VWGRKRGSHAHPNIACSGVNRCDLIRSLWIGIEIEIEWWNWSEKSICIWILHLEVKKKKKKKRWVRVRVRAREEDLIPSPFVSCVSAALPSTSTLPSASTPPTSSSARTFSTTPPPPPPSLCPPPPLMTTPIPTTATASSSTTSPTPWASLASSFSLSPSGKPLSLSLSLSLSLFNSPWSVHYCSLILPICRAIYLGETFCSYISINNSSNFEVREVIIKVLFLYLQFFHSTAIHEPICHSLSSLELPWHKF